MIELGYSTEIIIDRAINKEPTPTAPKLTRKGVAHHWEVYSGDMIKEIDSELYNYYSGGRAGH